MTAARKRLLCIRPRLHPQAGTILQRESEEWIEALALHADVTVIDSDTDLATLCARDKPDLIILGPANWTRCWYPELGNPRACPEIPRVLFMQCDPHDPLRAVTFRMARAIGVEAVFVNGDAYLQHMPELGHLPVFFAPQFLDDAVFRDYGLAKTIPISVFSSHLIPSFYKWRTELLAQVHHRFPTLIYTHPGYMKGVSAAFAVEGEAYARLINQSFFSAADTTRLDYGVRKHLEIPAAGSVLLAPDSGALRNYGFVDGENCLLGSGEELYGKIEALARSPEDYARVRQAGAALVHGRYTRRSWRLLLDWLDCKRGLKPGQVVQQVGRYGPFRGVTPVAPTPSVLATQQPASDMTQRLSLAHQAILAGRDLGSAHAALTEAAGWIGHVAEPVFLLGIVLLLHADPVNAALLIGRRAERQGTIDPALALFDPVETAWLLLIARIIGNLDLEAALQAQVAGADHVAIRRMAWLLGSQDDVATPDPGLHARRSDDLASVHWLGGEAFMQWRDLVGRVLQANRASIAAPALAERLALAA